MRDFSAVEICPVILSGGSGTRLWPMSRAQHPKQLLPLLSEQTLLQEAALRAALATIFQKREGAEFPDQATLDAALDALDPAELQRQVEAVVAPVVALIQQARGFDEIRAELASRYPAMDSSRLEQLLERAYFVADVWGRITADGLMSIPG